MQPVKVTIRKVSGPRTALSFLHSKLVSLVGKSNLDHPESCQMVAGCVHKEAIFVVRLPWV